MTSRDDILDLHEIYASNGDPVKFGLIYTNKCGWVDLGHANPEGALKLWKDVRRQTVSNACLSKPDQEVSIWYSQSMKKFGMSEVVTKEFKVKKQLTEEEQKAVALAIFLEVSYAFETVQSNWLYRNLTKSGFSVEDLVSDLIGFYRAVYPGKDFIKICEPVSKARALATWDTFGDVGDIKNKSTDPVLFPNPLLSCGRQYAGKLPAELSTITPAIKGTTFRSIP